MTYLDSECTKNYIQEAVIYKALPYTEALGSEVPTI